MDTNTIIKKVITIFILLILLCCVSSSLGILIYMSKSECFDEYKCTDKMNKCIDIPLYHSRNKEGKCVLACLNDDRCISNNQCIEIPKGHEKDTNNNCIVGSISGNITNPALQKLQGNISGNVGGNISGNIRN